MRVAPNAAGGSAFKNEKLRSTQYFTDTLSKTISDTNKQPNSVYAKLIAVAATAAFKHFIRGRLCGPGPNRIAVMRAGGPQNT